MRSFGRETHNNIEFKTRSRTDNISMGSSLLHPRTHTHTLMHTHARTHAHTQSRTHTHTCMHAHTHTHTLTHTHTHTHTHFPHSSPIDPSQVIGTVTIDVSTATDETAHKKHGGTLGQLGWVWLILIILPNMCVLYQALIAEGKVLPVYQARLDRLPLYSFDLTQPLSCLGSSVVGHLPSKQCVVGSSPT